MGKISYDDKLRKGPMSTKLIRPHSTHSTTMCGVWCFKHFTNFSHSHRPSQGKKVHCSRSVMTCHRQRSTKLSTTFANIWTRAL